MKIKSRKQLNKYLAENIPEDDSSFYNTYFMVTTDEGTEPVYFMEYKGYYFENSCSVWRVPFEEEEIEDYVKEAYYKKDRKAALEFEKSMYRDGYHYNIEAWQSSESFLPEEFDIEPISQQELLDWFIEHWDIFGNDNP